jgi:hypothetical protein
MGLMAGAGSRPALECEESSKNFAKIHACVSMAAASSPAFVKAFTETNYCAGNRVIRTKQELESLRYCDYIRDGELTIEVDDATADFYSMNDIDTIEGLIDNDSDDDGSGQHCSR